MSPTPPKRVEMPTNHLRREYTTLIGLEPSPFNWSFLSIVWSIPPMLVDLTRRPAQAPSRKRTVSSNVSYKSVSQCSSTFQEWELHSSTQREKDLDYLPGIKQLDCSFRSYSPFSFSSSQDFISDNNMRISQDQMERWRTTTGPSK